MKKSTGHSYLPKAAAQKERVRSFLPTLSFFQRSYELIRIFRAIDYSPLQKLRS